MKSRLISKGDLSAAVANWKWTLAACEGKAQEAVYQVGLKYKEYEATQIVWRDDVICVNFEGGFGRFTGTKKVRVGANLFDEEFEKAVRRKFVGKAFYFEKDGHEICCTVTECLRMNIPVITDEMAAAEGIEGVQTFDELYRYHRHNALRESFCQDYWKFVETYLPQCSFEISSEDVEEMVEDEMERCRGIGRTMDLVFDEMTSEQLLGAVGCASIPEFKDMICRISTRELKAALLLLDDNEAAAQLPTQGVNEKAYALQDHVVEMALDFYYSERKVS